MPPPTLRFDCATCGQRCERSLAEYTQLGPDAELYCGKKCRAAGKTRRRAAALGVGCDNCGDTPTRIARDHGLRLCRRCRAVWWTGCLGKSRFPDLATAAASADQQGGRCRPVTSYGCPICLGVHHTSATTPMPDEWVERVNGIAAAARRREAEEGDGFRAGHPARMCRVAGPGVDPGVPPL
jgi:hypothetical protein